MKSNARDLAAKKSLGQNFLDHQPTVDAIIVQARSNNVENVLEVGPGKGVLTRALLDAGLHVYAVEKDRRMIGYLHESLANAISSGQLRLREADVLEIPLDDIVAGQYQVVANLPYYITGMFLRTTLESETKPQAMTLMLQEEVVDRIVADNSKQSILSLSVNAYGTASKLARVEKQYFDPVPKVDSAVLALTNISSRNFIHHGISEKDFFSLVRTAFANKRKTLRNNIKDLLIENGSNFESLCTELKIDEKSRPEDLTLENYLKMTQLLNSVQSG